MNDPAQHLANELARRMTNQERDQTHPDSAPRDAATMILIDRSDARAKVLLGRRHAGHKFMPGKFVFPGGRIEAADRVMPAVRELDVAAQAKLTARVAAPSVEFARGLALAAVREVFEETGILLGVKREAPPAIPSELWDGFAKYSIYPDLGNLHFVARAITPPGRPRRFDTRFFTADAQTIAHRIDGVVGPDSELVELVWAPLDAAKSFDLPTVQQVVLEELAARVAAGMGHGLAVPFYHWEDQVFLRVLL
ncbi:MAG TPA: NUDIX hydrolase [Pseudolabrys sp.]|nr:NUDIX hydrolase [Pseudolabrys sp.]